MSKTHTVPSTTYKSFDLPDFIEDIPQEYLRMQIAQSFAWRIDVTLVQNVRTLMKAVADEARTSELDTAADMYNALAEQAFAEACFEDIGADSLGPVRAIHELMDLRGPAHAAAAAATRCVLDWKGHLRSYNEPSVSDLFQAQGTMKPRADTIAKITDNAMRAAAMSTTGKDVKLLAEQIIASRLAQERNKLAAMGQAMKAQSGALEQMFNIAMAKAPAGKKQCAFHQVHIETQRSLIAAAIQASQRAVQWAESDNNITGAENTAICVANYKVVAELKKVLVSPRFNAGIDGNAPRVTPMSVRAEPAPLVAPVAAKPKRVRNKKPAVTAAPAATPTQTLADMPSDVL